MSTPKKTVAPSAKRKKPATGPEHDNAIIVAALVEALRKAQEADRRLAEARIVSPQALKRPIGI
jgi:hypothetical protein